MRIKEIKRRNPNIHEHLEFWVKKTSYADRLQWLEEANAFVRSLKKAKFFRPTHH